MRKILLTLPLLILLGCSDSKELKVKDMNSSDKNQTNLEKIEEASANLMAATIDLSKELKDDAMNKYDEYFDKKEDGNETNSSKRTFKEIPINGDTSGSSSSNYEGFIDRAGRNGFWVETERWIKEEGPYSK